MPQEIPFNRPFLSGSESAYFEELLARRRFSGPGYYNRLCEDLLSEQLGGAAVLMTSSCTHALELAILLAEIQPGDEVILPSFTFVSVANAIVLRGGTPVFVDCLPGDMNIDPAKAKKAISTKTKAIIVMHYGGMACQMEAFQEMCRMHDLLLIEDAAHGIGASYKGVPLGTFGDLATFSFHETKNIQCGEGGALVVNNQKLLSRARRIREKGTNRPEFVAGKVSFYEWVDVGSSYLLGESGAAMLAAQLLSTEAVARRRRMLSEVYARELEGIVGVPHGIAGSISNGHLFYIKLRDRSERNALIRYLSAKGITASFHYIPLHGSVGGRKFGRFFGEDEFTSKESERLLRLPLYFDLSEDDQNQVIQSVKAFFS